jgi:hypothetical protein
VLKAGFELDQSSQSVGDLCESPRRKMYRCWTPGLGGVWLPQVHTPCAHNLVRGLLMRTMGPTPVATPEGLSRFGNAARELRRVLRGRVAAPVAQWDFEQVVASYREKRLRVRYEQAMRSLVTDGLCVRKDSMVKAFVKGEKLSRFKVHKPRVIMGRSPRYNLELASFLKPIEHAVYPGLRGWGRQFYTHTRLIGKGLNPEQRAQLIRRKFLAAPDMVCMEIDGKSFESHFSVPVLAEEHLFYTMFNSCPRLKKLLRWQQEFVGRGEGIRYKVSGVRASGDFNTGLGNTLVMCCLVLASAKLLGTRFDFLADGDNAILFLRKADLDVWRRVLPEVFLSMGFEVTLEDPATEFEQIVFGQSKPCFAAGRWTMVRDVYKVLSHAACGHQHFSEMKGGLRVLKSIGYCEAVLSRGVPVLQEYAHALLKATQHVSFSHAELGDFEYKAVLSRGISWAAAAKADITAEARLGFEKSWGISLEEQVRMERVLARGFEPPRSWGDCQLCVVVPDITKPWTLVAHEHSHFGDLA